MPERVYDQGSLALGVLRSWTTPSGRGVVLVLLISSGLLVSPALAAAQQRRPDIQAVTPVAPVPPRSAEAPRREPFPRFAPPQTPPVESLPTVTFGPRFRPFPVEDAMRGLAVGQARESSYQLMWNGYAEFGRVSQRLGTTLGVDMFSRGGTPVDGFTIRTSSRQVDLFRLSSFGSSRVTAVLSERRTALWQPSLTALERANKGVVWLERANATVITGLQLLEGARLFRDLVDLHASSVQLMAPSPFFPTAPGSASVTRTVSSQIGPFILGDATLTSVGSYQAGPQRVLYQAAVRVTGSGLGPGTIKTTYETHVDSPTARSVTVFTQGMPSQNAVERYAAIYFPAASFDPGVTSSRRYTHTVTTTGPASLVGLRVPTNLPSGLGQHSLAPLPLSNALRGGSGALSSALTGLQGLQQSWHANLEAPWRGAVAMPQSVPPTYVPLSGLRLPTASPVQTLPSVRSW